MVVVEIAADDSERVIALGELLRDRFQQNGVGYAVDGVYSRITVE